MVLFGKWEALMTSQNELDYTKIRAADQFRN